MKKRTKIFMIIGMFLLVIGYFFYKGYHYMLYRPEIISDKNYLDFMNSFEVHDDMIIQKKETEKYFTFQNIKIRNDFSNYEFISGDENSSTYYLYNDKKEITAVFRIGIEETNIDKILKIDAFAEKEDKEQFLKENHIENDLDLLNYVLEKHQVTNTIFTTVKNMKFHSMTQYYTYTTLSNPTYVTRITGDYEGYIIGGEIFQNWTNVNTVSILKNNKLYKFSFWVDTKFTEEYLKDLIETLVIEENTYVTLENENPTFTRTYHIIDIIENNSRDSISLEIKQFQDETSQIIEIPNAFVTKIEKNKNYEFTFQKKNTNPLENNILSIFKNTILISVEETSKTGLEQVQESIP